jgi:SAM-dependent methyltransferase
MSSADKETYIVDRYRLWRHKWQPANYAYKHVKGARIAQILGETGGLAPMALEMGVGPGGVAAELSRRGMRVVGIDLSPDALARAKEHCREDDVHLLRASGFALPFADSSLDLIYASQVLHLFDRAGRLALMQEVHRVLRKGGRFVFDMKNIAPHAVRYFGSPASRRERNFPAKSELFELLRQSGYSTIDTRPGVLPRLGWVNIPNVALFRALAHTTFFVASRG